VVRWSSRTPASLTPGPWARRLSRLRAEGRPLIDLSEHNPTTAGLVPPTAAFAVPATYEPSPSGLAPARAAVSGYYAERGIALAPDRLVLTAGTSEGYAHAFRLLCDPGETVLVPRPSYPLFEPIAHAEGCRVAPYALRLEDGAWRLPEGALEAALDAAPGTRAVVVVLPNHPTGSFLTREEAGRVRAVCARAGVALISDEVFADFHAPYGRAAAELAPTLLGDAGGPLTLALSGLSKVCGLPQVKVGWIALDGPQAAVESAHERLEWLADAFLTVSHPAQGALPALLAGRHAFQDVTRARVARNRAALEGSAARIAGARVLPADGGWSAVIALPPVRGDEEWALALLEHDVVAHPGHFYDFEEPGLLVLSLLPDPTDFDRALGLLVEITE
jgi:aspartate/methionine/tyrosine aminotransferase